MIVSDAVETAHYSVSINFSVGRRNRKKLAADMFLRCAAFRSVYVRGLCAYHSVEGAGDCLQAQDVRSSAAEDKKDLRVFAEMLAKLLNCRSGVRVMPVGRNVPRVYRRESLENFGMNAGPVIGCEMPARSRHLLASLGDLGGELGISALVERAELEIAPENLSILPDDEHRAARISSHRVP